MFCLATYADGPYWQSSLEMMLYPPGFSFYRPFSYKREYLTRDLQDIVAAPEQLRDVPRWYDGYVGMRFRDTGEPRFRGVFIPLRRVTLTAIAVDDTVQVFFRFGEYILPPTDNGLANLSLDGIVDYSKPETTLFFFVPQDRRRAFNDVTLSPDFPPQFWQRLMTDGVVSQRARAHFLNAMVLRLCQVRLHGTDTPIQPALLEKRGAFGRFYGVRLKEGKVYDIDLVYQSLAEPGAAHLPSAQFEWIHQGDVLKTPFISIPVTGNYRSVTRSIEVLNAAVAPVELGFVPATHSPHSSPASEVKGPRMCFLASIASRFWSPWRTLHLILVLVALVPAIWLAIVAYQATKDDRPFWLALLAIPTALLGAFVKDFIAGVRK